MQLHTVHCAIRQSDGRDTLEFSPAAATISLSQICPDFNTCSAGNDLDIANYADNRKFHDCGSAISGLSKPVNESVEKAGLVAAYRMNVEFRSEMRSRVRFAAPVRRHVDYALVLFFGQHP
jgi:hypothetical protein